MQSTRRLGLVGSSLLLWSGGVALAEDSKTEARDARLEKAIETRLEKDDALKFQGLDATVMEGKVTLTGTTVTKADRDKAARLANGVKGVSRVDNQIVIRGSAETDAETSTSGTESKREDDTLTPDGKTPPANERRQDPLQRN